MLNLDDILSKVKEDREKDVVMATSSNYKAPEELFKPKAGNTYYFRFLPEHPETVKDWRARRSYAEHSFNSRTTGQFIFLGRSLTDSLSDQTVKNDPVKIAQIETYTKAKREKDQELHDVAKNLFPRRKELMNIYVHKVDGPDQEVVGKVLVWKYNATLGKEGEPKGDIYPIIVEALTGSKQKNIGSKAFDLSENGRSFALKVSVAKLPNGTEIPNFKGSAFEDAEDIGLNKKQIDAIQKQSYDLSKYIPEVKPTDEVKKLLDEHWFGLVASPEDEIEPQNVKSDLKDDDDEIPMGDDDAALDALLNQ